MESVRELDSLEDANMALAGGELLAGFVNLLVLVGKAALELEIGISMIPHIQGYISARLTGVAEQNGFVIARIAAKELCPHALAAVGRLKRVSMLRWDDELPKRIDHDGKARGQR